jgi:DNA-binding CsgD family transcriptional regulator/tetratricopeptide (TPR) repeat protein
VLGSLLEKSLHHNDQPAQPHRVAGLAGVSLPAADAGQPLEPRLAMLESVREFGLEQLVACGEEAAVRRWHAEHYLALAEEATPDRSGGPERIGGAAMSDGFPEPARAWLDRMEVEHDDLRQALHFWAACARDGEPEPGLQLAGALWKFWYIRGYWREGHTWLDRMLTLGTRAAPRVRLRALWGAGFPAWNLDTPDRAQARLEERLALHRALEDRRGTDTALLTLGTLALNQGNYAVARERGIESLAGSRALENRWCAAWSLHLLADVALRQGDDEQAQALADESLSLFHELGHVGSLSTALRLQAVLARSRGDRAAAAGHYAESLQLLRALGGVAGIAAGLQGCGYVALDAGDASQALALFQESLAVYREIGDTPKMVGSLFALADALADLGQPVEAAQLASAAQARRDALPVPASVPGYPRDHARHERYVVALQATLGQPAFAASWAKGQAMSLEQAIATALGGAPRVAPRAPPAAATATTKATEPPMLLTRREQEVAQLVARGLSSREIASTLSITERTAENHVEHILSKLGFRSRVQIATWVVERDRAARREPHDRTGSVDGVDAVDGANQEQRCR